jgi:hypothetical protein
VRPADIDRAVLRKDHAKSHGPPKVHLVTGQLRYLDVVILLVIGCIAMYAIPALIDGYRKLQHARELARHIEGEQEAREALRQSWEARK